MSLSQRKWIYKLLSYTQIRELVPESQAYMDLLAFERKLDQTIMRKRLDIQEALKRPIKVCFPSVGIDVLDNDLQVGICCNTDIVTVSYRKLFLQFLLATRHQVYVALCVFIAKEKTPDLHLKHLQSSKTRCRGWRRHSGIMGAACRRSSAGRCKITA